MVQKKPDGSFEVECDNCKHDIDGVSEETFVEVPPQPVVCLAVPYNRLYSCPHV